MRKLLPLLLLAAAGAAGAERKVDVATAPGAKWDAKTTRLLEDLPPLPVDAGLNTFGGLPSEGLKATGFFRVQKVGDRQWLVDPAGGLFHAHGIVSVSSGATESARAARDRLYKDKAGWAAATNALLRANGFNCTGAWSDDEALAAAPGAVAQTPLIGFMSGYAKERGGAKMVSGHLAYPGDCPFIFDPGFPAACERIAAKVAARKADPLILGYFTDNEMPWSLQMLDRYLALPESDPGRQAAAAWLAARHAGKPADADREDFLEHAADLYFRTCAAALRKHDPNHLLLGARFHGGTLKLPRLFRAAGRHCDVISVNYYRAWTPSKESMAMWAKESGRPFLVTEWYAKAADSGMGNLGGAGWFVRTQADRGMFYQNFTLGLLEERQCVGWQWFKYADNDPEDKNADPSNKDSNKGIITARFVPYEPLLARMKEQNQRVYGLIRRADQSAPAK